MSDLDERIGAEIHRHQGSVAPVDAAELLRDVSQRVDLLRRRHQVKGRIVAAICALVVLAGITAGVGLSSSQQSTTTKPPAAHNSTIDPKAGKGGFTISPTEHLRNGQHVTVLIHGLEPAESVSVLMCSGVPHTFAVGHLACSSTTQFNATTNDKGSAHLTYTVKQYFTIGWDYQVNCATYPQGCSIAVVDPYNASAPNGTGNIEPVTFAPGATPPASPVSISVTPGAPFTDGEQVVVNGSGFPANVAVRVAECPVNADCSDLWKLVQSSPTGTFSTTISIQQVFTFNGNPGPITIDCGQPLSCFIASETNSPNDVVYAPGVPVTFAAPAP
jgi:hypothetical protein